jgi:thiosulfate dehydrogenase
MKKSSGGVSRSLTYILVLFVIGIVVTLGILMNRSSGDTKQVPASKAVSNHAASGQIPEDAWKAPEESSIPAGKEGEMIRYGKDLLAHTSQYFGPNGSIAMISNGLNCQNCHLAGGTKLFGNNYASFISSYPKMSNRSGRIEPAAERIAECFERSLGGSVPDTAGREVQAMLAYMKWVGKDVKKGQKLFGNASEKLDYLDYAADPEKGKAVFMAKCKVCHGASGEGILNADKKTYLYPPLWGKHSYNDGAGMYRLSNFAGFVKNNMPFGSSYQSPQLTNEEAWNVAAFVNSQPRPHRDQHEDWKDLSKKPIDAPFGPYADGFSEKQHKYGPFKPIKDAQKRLTTKEL